MSAAPKRNLPPLVRRQPPVPGVPHPIDPPQDPEESGAYILGADEDAPDPGEEAADQGRTLIAETATMRAAADQRTPEEKQQAIADERAQTLAAIPMIDGRPVPALPGPTQEQLENNPSDWRPPVEDSNPSVLADEAKAAVVAPPPDTDLRQLWVCQDTNGIRTGHPAFHSDVHLIEQLVRCPKCDGTSVRRVGPGEKA